MDSWRKAEFCVPCSIYGHDSKICAGKRIAHYWLTQSLILKLPRKSGHMTMTQSDVTYAWYEYVMPIRVS